MKKKTFSDILGDLSDDGLARMRRKVPEWSAVEGIEYPSRLATEQCSSSATAAYKAALVRRIRPSCGLLADLTGGLGVDCAVFSRVCDWVLYNEMDPGLAAAVERNFTRLGITNVVFSSVEINQETLPTLLATFSTGRTDLPAASADGSADMPDASAGIQTPYASIIPSSTPLDSGTSACLAPTGPDIIFLDPARRSTSGRKVFLLEDCSPDILELRDGLLAAAPDVLAKLSPMADISMVCRRLGSVVREIHVVGADGECKELLVWMQRGWQSGATIVIPDLSEQSANPVELLRFTAEEEATSSPRLLPSPAFLDAITSDTSLSVTDSNRSETSPKPTNPLTSLTGHDSNHPEISSSPTCPLTSLTGHDSNHQETSSSEPESIERKLSPEEFNGFLFEPTPALMKAGCFNLLCERLDLYKLGRSTHLYFTGHPSKALTSYGKVFRIDSVLPFNNATVKSLGRTLPHCSVTARNLPISSDALSTRLGIKSSKSNQSSNSDIHVFAFTADFSDAPSQRLIAITHRV